MSFLVDAFFVFLSSVSYPIIYYCILVTWCTVTSIGILVVSIIAHIKHCWLFTFYEAEESENFHWCLSKMKMVTVKLDQFFCKIYCNSRPSVDFSYSHVHASLCFLPSFLISPRFSKPHFRCPLATIDDTSQYYLLCYQRSIPLTVPTTSLFSVNGCWQ